MKKLRIKSTYPPALFKWNGMTRVVAGTITEVNGKPWNHPYVAITGHIELSDIEWVRPTLPPRIKPTVRKVKGSKGNWYTITKMTNGKELCSCPGFQYRRFCKHTGAK